MNTWWNLSICRLSSKNVRSVRYPLRLKREAFKVLYFKERHLMAFQTFQRVRWFSLHVYVLFWRQSRAWRLRWHPPNGNFIHVEISAVVFTCNTACIHSILFCVITTSKMLRCINVTFWPRPFAQTSRACPVTLVVPLVRCKRLSISRSA